MSMVGADVILKVIGLKKNFGQTHALRDLNLECKTGTVHTIFGQNGSGKTTLLKILSGILRPSAGVILFNGVPMTRFEPRAAQESGILAVFQEILIAPARSVLDNIFLGYDRLFSFHRGLNKPRRVEMAQELFSRLSKHPIDFDSAAGSHPLAVKQLIVIARALIRNPTILLLDEPTSTLDIDGKTLLFDAIGGVIGQGKVVIFISHRIDEVMEISDYVTVLNSGWSVSTIPRKDLNSSKILEAVSMEISADGKQDCR